MFVRSVGLNPKMGALQTHPTVSANLINLLQRGDVKVVPNIQVSATSVQPNIQTTAIPVQPNIQVSATFVQPNIQTTAIPVQPNIQVSAIRVIVILGGNNLQARLDNPWGQEPTQGEGSRGFYADGAPCFQNEEVFRF